MKKIIAFVLLVALGLTGYFYRAEIKDFLVPKDQEKATIARNKPIPREQGHKKEINVFEVGKKENPIFLVKSGTTLPESTVNVMPQISGRILGINVKVGQKVNEGTALIELGDSLATDMAIAQYNSAVDNYNLAAESSYVTSLSGNQTLKTAQLGIQQARTAYENSILTRANTEDLLENQLDAVKDSVDDLEDNLDDTKEDYEDALNNLDKLEDRYNSLSGTLPSDDPALKKLSEAISQTKTQISGLKSAKKELKNAIEQAENGLTQLEDTRESQLDQLNFGIESSFLQYKTALSQIQSAYYGVNLQNIASQGQQSQALSAIEMANLSLKQQIVTSPIEGTVTEITAEEGNMASPGQVLIKVANEENLKVKTSLSEEEASLIKEGETVFINGEQGIRGKITSIGTSLNEITKKIEVEIEVSQKENLMAQAFVEIYFPVRSAEKIFIPLNAVYLEENRKIVKIVNDKNRIEFKEVTLGNILDQYIEVLSGLSKGEKIANTPSITLEENSRVILINE